ncbi:MAG: tRNA epoxyqueuosine(34) reductase QueG [Mariniphaga sp.]|nr:tRNA epoxyqueuosine(34) reductase QueG [Mariniphaga sp.]
MDDLKNISAKVKSKAKELGFLECAILPAESLGEEKERLHAWLEADMFGEMHYMARNRDKRLDPRLLFPPAKTVVLVLQNYYSNKKQKDPEAPVISQYAYGIDYHRVMKEKLKNLLASVQKEIPECKGRFFVDSAPVLERAWARRAGLGWIGKNSCLISKNHGSFFFIGELILDVELHFDKPKVVTDHCGSCTRCIDACPTSAIVADRVVDARKCISYQTIELKREPDEKLKGLFQNRVFGCDICQDVCPWNRKAEPHNERLLSPSVSLLELTKQEWYNLDEEQFIVLFDNSAVKRTGFHGLKRNLQFIASGKED